MSDSDNQISRKGVLEKLVILPALAALWSTGSLPAQAAQGSKAQFKYQNSPKDGKHCSGCSLFIAGKSLANNGQCKVVSGMISPNGWCIAFQAK